MSYSSQVKTEITSKGSITNLEKLAELYGIFQSKEIRRRHKRPKARARKREARSDEKSDRMFGRA